jgi:hypothetical protein
MVMSQVPTRMDKSQQQQRHATQPPLALQGWDLSPEGRTSPQMHAVQRINPNHRRISLDGQLDALQHSDTGTGFPHQRRASLDGHLDALGSYDERGYPLTTPNTAAPPAPFAFDAQAPALYISGGSPGTPLEPQQADAMDCSAVKTEDHSADAAPGQQHAQQRHRRMHSGRSASWPRVQPGASPTPALVADTAGDDSPVSSVMGLTAHFHEGFRRLLLAKQTSQNALQRSELSSTAEQELCRISTRTPSDHDGASRTVQMASTAQDMDMDILAELS